MDLLQNGDFEQLAAGWVPGRDPVPAEIVATPVHAGGYSLKLGEDASNLLSYSSARQTVTIPTGYGQILLDFWTWTWADDTGGSDRQEADFLSTGGLVLQKFWRVTANDRAWVQHIIPVTSYAGQTVQLYFNAYNDGSGDLAGMYVDDAHVWACPNPVAPAAGQPSATPLPPTARPPTMTPTPLPPTARPPTMTPTPSVGQPGDPAATATISQAGAEVTVIVLGNGQSTAVAKVAITATAATEPTPTPQAAGLVPAAAGPPSPSASGPALTATPVGAAPAGPLAGAATWLRANWPKPWWMPIAVLAALILALILLRSILVGSAFPP